MADSFVLGFKDCSFPDCRDSEVDFRKVGCFLDVSGDVGDLEADPVTDEIFSSLRNGRVLIKVNSMNQKLNEEKEKYVQGPWQ